jgi:two-component system, LytTR family, response regulator
VIRACVVDDERLAVRRLVRLLEATGRVEAVCAETDPEAALEFLRTHTVDVLFVDVKMPGLNGFELIQRLDSLVPVVFVTAFDRYALAAFEVNSVDYLLKPVDAERLSRALDKIERLARAAPLDVRTLARELAVQMEPRRQVDRIASRTGERTTMIDLQRVSYFTAKDKATFAVVGGREHLVEQTLSELEALLDPKRFCRIHRGTIVNVSAVQELDRWVDGGVLVRLKDEKRSELPVARDRVRELKNRLGI